MLDRHMSIFNGSSKHFENDLGPGDTPRYPAPLTTIMGTGNGC